METCPALCDQSRQGADDEAPIVMDALLESLII
jgi:hypothetical protein